VDKRRKNKSYLKGKKWKEKYMKIIGSKCQTILKATYGVLNNFITENYPNIHFLGELRTP
jgi:hypothetical protein